MTLIVLVRPPESKFSVTAVHERLGKSEQQVMIQFWGKAFGMSVICG